MQISMLSLLCVDETTLIFWVFVEPYFINEKLLKSTFLNPQENAFLGPFPAPKGPLFTLDVNEEFSSEKKRVEKAQPPSSSSKLDTFWSIKIVAQGRKKVKTSKKTE